MVSQKKIKTKIRFNPKETKKNKIIIKMSALAAVAIALTQAVQAVPVSGSIGFTGRVTFDTISAANATKVIAWVNPTVNGTSGSFTTVANETAAAFTAPWNFNTGLVNPFWSVGGFTYSLTSSYIQAQGGVPGVSGYIVVNGIGTVSGNGYDATALSWSFSAQGPSVTQNPDSFTFSASANSVPDAGTTSVLLGSCLFGMAFLKKKITAKA